MKNPKIPLTVVRRLPLYLRSLTECKSSGSMTVSSQELGEALDLNPAQIRKDLAFFGEFGRKGIGYEVQYLINKIEHILKLDRNLPVALVGAGHLGTALCQYSQNRHNTVEIQYVFDASPLKIGSQICDLRVRPVGEMEDCIRQNDVKMAIIAVPAEHAQTVVEQLVASGITAVLNFAPVSLRVPDKVHVRNADFTTELLSLAYYAASDE